MEKNKKLWKTLLIILIAIICVYTIFVLIRLNILTQISKMNREYMEESNYYISLKIDDSIITNYWRKDNTYKKQILSPALNGEEFSGNVFWYDSITEEKYRYIESEKYYQEDENAEWEVMADTIIYDLIIPTKEEETWERFTYAMNPLNIIKTSTYNGKECYIFKYEYEHSSEEMYIEKDTGLCVLCNSVKTSYSNNGAKQEGEVLESSYTIEYSFNTVTDEDVAKPDFSEYQLY